jgi:antitoxin CcdA
MPRFDNAPTTTVSLLLDSKVLERAQQMGMDVTQTVNSLLAAEVERRYWERWNDDNKEAIAAYNARIAEEGLPLAKYRTFGSSLGDGKKP